MQYKVTLPKITRIAFDKPVRNWPLYVNHLLPLRKLKTEKISNIML